MVNFNTKCNSPIVIYIDKHHAQSYGVGLSTFSGVARRMPSYIPRSKSPTSLMGVAEVVCQTPFFSIETLTILSIQQVVVFRLAATLCKSGETTNVVFRMEDIYVPPTSPHLVFEANHTKIPKVQPKSQHAIVAKLHDVLVRLTID